LLSHRFQNIPGCDGVLIQVTTWMIRPEAHIGISGEVDYQIGAGHCLAQHIPFQQIPLHKSELGMRHRALQKPRLAGRKIIEPDNGVAHSQKPVHHIAADEPSRTRHKNTQENSPIEMKSGFRF
jgi:hypothetical protein